ncbi:MAG: (2Fe-2S)-binding protein [Gammaproteobacteria bacterium]|nr:(2Fe-2S)-binding protein [Gammaproteobacteria bacterium]
MFKRIELIDKPVRFYFEDREIVAQQGDSVAAALLAAGVTRFRQTAESGDERGPFCMIGNCFDCLLEIDGVPNLQACRHSVSEDMQVRRQCGPTRLVPDHE